MFVLPPPPKSYPGAQQQQTPVNPGAPTPLTETNNTLKHPTGPEYQLVVGEGTYVLRDDFQLSTPPPHPSEAPVVSTNPLSTTIAPPTQGVKLTLVITSGNKAPPQIYNLDSAANSRPNFSTYSIKEFEEPRKSQDTKSNESDVVSQPLTSSSSGKAPAFGATNALLANPGVGKDPSKRKKPKTNMMKTNSTFISRMVPHEALARRLQERDADCILCFANINRAVQWLDLTSDSYFKAEHLTKVLFTKAHMLCHDANDLTKTSNHIDLVAGSSAGDIVWYEPFSQRYNRINKNGVINPAPVSDVKWIPGSESLFLASHWDGTLIVYDKEREDAAFVPEEISQITTEQNGDGVDTTALRINKSVNSKNQKTNPVAFWKISNQRINQTSFSPDCRHLAVVSEDGSLRIIDYLREVLLDLYTSYYGALTCCCWSPDGKYLLTGGQDDLVSIWSLADRSIVARCPGHQSWVSAVAFDPWRCDDKNYRFGSVGEDCRLLLWDFNYSMLHKPKATAARTRSITSSATLARQRTETQSATRLRSNSSLTTNSTDGDDTIEHPVVSRTKTAELPPVMSKIVDDDPLAWLGFQEDCIATSCLVGHIRIWDRPKETVNEE